MAKKRQPFSFPELEGRGRGAILRTTEELQAEQELLQSEQPDAPESTDSPVDAQESTAASPQSSTERRSRAPAHVQETESTSTDAEQASNLDSELASTIASNMNEAVAAIRRVVRGPGREVAFVRLSAEEKAELADVVYTFKRQGRKTTENEINRIAVNFILQDYRANGEHSILTRVLAALRA